jgi:hypothetical protein
LDELAGRLQATVDLVESLLGETLRAIEASYERGLASATPPSRPHRLGRMMHLTRQSIAALTAGKSQLELWAVAELETLLDTAQRWSTDPLWPGIVASIRSAENYLHAVTLLTVASYLRDAGNPVGLRPEREQVRTADLWILMDSEQHFSVEVKTPVALEDPSTLLTHEGALRIIRKSLSRARTGPGGQLSEESPALLLIGGFHLDPQQDMATLEHAATEVLRRWGKEKPHLAGIVLSSFVLLLHNAFVDPEGRVGGGAESSFEMTLQVEIVRNPHYTGSFGLDTTPRGDRMMRLQFEPESDQA